MTQLTEERRERLKQIWDIINGPNFYYQGQFYESRDDQQLLGDALLLLQETFSLLDSQAAGEEQRGYWPTLLDRGDGVVGHFCIGRLIKPDEAYWEFWNKGEWTSAGEVFVGREAAQKQLDAIRVGDEIDLLNNNAVNKELRRWQDAIRSKCVEKITAQAKALEHDRGNCAMSVRIALYEAIGALSSLTLDEVKPGEM